MKKCPYCGWSIEDDAKQCPKCKAGIPHEEKVTNEPDEPERVSRRKNKE